MLVLWSQHLQTLLLLHWRVSETDGSRVFERIANGTKSEELQKYASNLHASAYTFTSFASVRRWGLLQISGNEPSTYFTRPLCAAQVWDCLALPRPVAKALAARPISWSGLRYTSMNSCRLLYVGNNRYSTVAISSIGLNTNLKRTPRCSSPRCRRSSPWCCRTRCRPRSSAPSCHRTESDLFGAISKRFRFQLPDR